MTPIDWLMSRDTGISSKTICSVLTGSKAPDWHDTPGDPDDFGRCYRLLALFPDWRARMPEVAAKYPKWGPMVAAWDELTALYEQCSDKDGHYTRESYRANKDAADRLFERMQALNSAGYEAAGWTRDGPNCWRGPGVNAVHVAR
jgi:hypothetical protein